MFGKMQGSRWARNRPTKSKQQTTEVEQQSDEFCSEFTQTTSDIVHSKRRIEWVFFLIERKILLFFKSFVLRDC
jgi:hypothetical protein